MDTLDQAIADAHQRYVAARPESARLHERARAVLPGGNTRSVLDFAPFPFRVESAAGSSFVDVDGHEYVDFCGNYTAGLLGFRPELVRAAVVAALDEGFAFGATHPREIELAELVCERFASIDLVRFTNSASSISRVWVAPMAKPPSSAATTAARTSSGRRPRSPAV